MNENKYGLLKNEWYDGVIKGYLEERPHWKIKMKDLVQVAKPEKNEKILDVGCGYGLSAIECAKRGADVTALDISNKALECTKKIAKVKGAKLNTIKADCVKMEGVPEEYFDKVVYANITEHLLEEDTINSFKNAYKSLKKGGKVVIYAPNKTHISEYIRLKSIEGHIGLNTNKEIIKYLKLAGFEILESYNLPSSLLIIRQLDILFQGLIPGFKKRVCVVAKK